MLALLGIDLGTTGVKAALFATEDGQVLASAFVESSIKTSDQLPRPKCRVYFAKYIFRHNQIN